MPQPTDALRIGSLCTGYGGLDTAVQRVFGGSLAWVADNDPGASRILAHHHPHVPNLGDLTGVDWNSLAPVDVVCGGYPCQPFSSAGKRKGTADARHLWPHIARALGVLRPRYAVFENVGGHLRLGFDTVLADLAALGFDAEWCVVRASEVGAPHPRRRLFIVATNAHALRQQPVADPWCSGATVAQLARADAATYPSRGGLNEHGELPAGRDALRRGVRDDAPRCGPTPVADATRIGRGEGRPEPARQQGGSGAAGGGAPDWGRFGPAIERWQAVLGRPAPWPVDDLGRLNPPFVEWLMGLTAGHVTDVPELTRTQQLRALGNGV
uniref:DNA cytosine methyltransferase n=1 Tax=Streptomyces sp. NRRL S-337 TaxID=1463900 RepID=UPI00099DF13D